MRLTTLIVAVLTVCFGASSMAWAIDVPPMQQPKMALHIDTHQSRGCTKGVPSISSQDDLVRVWDSYGDIDVFVYIFNYNRLMGVDYSLVWPEEWGTTSFTSCSDLIIGDPHNPGDGISQAWTSCKSRYEGAPAFLLCGWAWLYASSDGEIKIMDLPGGGDQWIRIGDCADSSEDLVTPDSVFYAGVNVDPYEGPPVYATRPTTWGAIKAMFR